MARYTVKQGKFASFLVNRKDRDGFRKIAEADSRLRCYMFTAMNDEGGWYPIIQANEPPHEAIPLGGGRIRVLGTGKKRRYEAHSAFCGVVYEAGGGQEM